MNNLKKYNNFMVWIDQFTFYWYQSYGVPVEVLADYFTENDDRVRCLMDIFVKQVTNKDYNFEPSYVTFLREWLKLFWGINKLNNNSNEN